MNITQSVYDGPVVTEADLARMHQSEWNWSRRQRFVLQRDPRRNLSDAMETLVRGRLDGRGYFTTAQRHKSHFDLLAQGVRIEVKAGTWDGQRYPFNLHNNAADVLVAGCLNVTALGQLVSPVFFVIPFDLVKGQTFIKITSRDPRDYVGRFTPWYEAWEIIDELVLAGRNAWQPQLVTEAIQ